MAQCAVDDQDKGVCTAARSPQLPQNRCDIAVRNASTLTFAAFERLRGEPLLIRGAAAHWPAQHRWTRSWLIEQLHNLPILESQRFEGQPVPPEVIGYAATMRAAINHSGSDNQPYFIQRFLHNGSLVLGNGQN